MRTGGVLVEADVRTVRTPALLAGADDDRLDDLALLDVAARMASLTVATMTSPMPA
jgi:hypothetical protein